LIDAPCLDETYVGKGAEAAIISKGERSPISTSGCKRMAEARFSTTDPFMCGAGGGLQRVLKAVRVTRYGHDAYAYARLAGGSIDLVIENGLKSHDYSALIPVVRAAGGHFGDWTGGTDFAMGNVIAAASRELYEEAVELLAEA
jgi:fructose-1,6-bisphosphatase/inositol monophosphatase family enzyme